MNAPTAKRICSHFGVANYKLNQDLNDGFLIDCIPWPRKGMPRRWDEKSFIATHFYFDLQDQGMSRRRAGKLASAIALFAGENPDEGFCAMMRRDGYPLEVVKCGEVPAPQEWPENMISVSFFNLRAARKTYQEKFMGGK